jgi:hypothetical protein
MEYQKIIDTFETYQECHSPPGRLGPWEDAEQGSQLECRRLLLYSDYFADNAINTPKKFRRRFRMNKDLFIKIVQGVREYDDYFKYKKDCTRKWGFTSVQKCTAALRCIAYGAPPDTSVDYL